MRISLVGLAFSLLVGCGAESGSDAGAGMDAGRVDVDSGVDVGSDAGTDAGTDAGDLDAGTDAGTDAGDVDAGPVCEGNSVGACADGALECLCCPAGGPAQNCLCTTACNADSDCTDPARPTCNQPPSGGGGGPTGICAPPSFVCAWGAVCAAPDTPIATPSGERAIAQLRAGDLIYSMHEGALVPRPLIRVSRTPVIGHAVVRALLETGVALYISGPHPTADGRPFSALRPGDSIDGTQVLAVETVPYQHAYTHDILADSDSGTYVAGGVLIGSTLTP